MDEKKMDEEPLQEPEQLDDRYGLEEALDGELPRERVAMMIDHARTCPECAEELARLRAVKDLVRRSCGADTAPQTLRERISVQYHRVEVTRDGVTSSLTEHTVRREL